MTRRAGFPVWLCAGVLCAAFAFAGCEGSGRPASVSCTPGTARCGPNGASAEVCTADGTGWQVNACAGATPLCRGGACVFAAPADAGPEAATDGGAQGTEAGSASDGAAGDAEAAPLDAACGGIGYGHLIVNDPAGWKYGGNPPNAASFYEVTVPAGNGTLQIGLAGEVPKAFNNDMLVSDTDFGCASRALGLYEHFCDAVAGTMNCSTYNGPETYAVEYPLGSGAHYWFKFASNSESENVQVNNAAGKTYYVLITNTTPNASLWLIEANAF